MAMQKILAIGASVLIAQSALASSAHANSRGAMWGAGRADAPVNCGTCHFGDVQSASQDAVNISGLPATIKAGKTYAITLSVTAPDGRKVGFLIDAPGSFSAPGDGLRAKGGEIASAEPVEGEASWSIDWTAPATLSEGAQIYLGVNLANGDRTAFGDQIRFDALALPQ